MAVPLWLQYVDAFPDFRSELIRAQTTENGLSVICEVINSGTQRKDIAGIQNRGRAFEVPHLFIFDLDKGGSIQQITSYWDGDTLYAQLGYTAQHE